MEQSPNIILVRMPTDQFELTGLKNNLIYYIVISAFDDEMNNESDFSGEIQARPME